MRWLDLSNEMICTQRQNYYFGSKVKVKTGLSFALFFLIFANSFLCG